MANLESNHILIGLGGTGGKILRAFKMRMFEEFPNKEEREKQPVALLYVDSTREMMGIGRPDMDVMGQDASFGENEFLFIKGVDVPELLENVGSHPELNGIVKNVGAVRTAVGNLGEAAGQKRRAGRLLFAVNASKYVTAVKNCFASCHTISHNDTKNVHIFAGLCGGTGSGSIIDAICQVRNIPGWEMAHINVYAMIPEQDLPSADMDKGRYYENGYAALRELNALQCGVFNPSDVLNSGEPLDVFNEGKIKGVANGITVYSNANENGVIVNSFEELPKIVSDYVYSRIFLIGQKGNECEDIIRAFNFENMDGFEFEVDETCDSHDFDQNTEMPKVRTRKVSSFGLKRIIYPELRVLKHMTYSVGKDVLCQFQYNHWRQGLGFIDEEQNIDYRKEYLNDETLSRWMLDLDHLSLDTEILKAKDGTTYDSFQKEWSQQVADLVDLCRQDKDPLILLYQQMENIYQQNFRDEGVEKYFREKARSIDAIAAEVRSTIEKELYNKWADGNISIIELQKIGELMSAYVATDLKTKIEGELDECKKKLKISNDELEAIHNDFGSVSLFGKIVKKKDDYYVQYQTELTYNLVTRTRIVAYTFAKDVLVSVLQRYMNEMSSDINRFGSMLNDAISETKRLIAAQQKHNKGLEDISGAVIEVSEEERMLNFEDNIRLSKDDMVTICNKVRQSVIPQTEFKNFADLLTRLNEKTIKRAFDVTLAEIINEKHNQLPKTATKILGLNILTQLQQKLGSNMQNLQEFARKVLQQSGVYIKTDRNQVISRIRNNEDPDETKNINLREVLISLPSPDDDVELTAFANDLKRAFESQMEQGVKAPKIFMGSPRKNEMSIITINYALPMRALSWLAGYKKRYDRFLDKNKPTYLNHAILLHSEGLGEDLPDIFAKSNKELEELDRKRNAERQNFNETEHKIEDNAGPTRDNSVISNDGPTLPPKGPELPPVGQDVMPKAVEPTVSVFVWIANQKWGPYDYKTLKTLVERKQLTTETPVWMQGLQTWTPAGQVALLGGLFAPAMPSMQPTPDMPPQMPPMMP